MEIKTLKQTNNTSFKLKNELTHRIAKPKFAKGGFTLSEVLITLGIIGVVAAITLPTLMTKIQERVLKQQYKKAFSVMNQALRQLYYNNDTIPLCYYEPLRGGGRCEEYNDKGICIKYDYSNGYGQGPDTECTLMYKELLKVLKVSNICENDSYKKGCIPKYKGNDTILKDNHNTGGNNDYTDEDAALATRGCSGYNQSNLLNKSKTVVLLDGTIIGVYGGSSIKTFYIDVNGKKGPNRWGYDVFEQTIRSDGNKLYIGEGVCSMKEKGGKTPKQMLQ